MSLEAWLQPAPRITQPLSAWTVFGFEVLMDPARVPYHEAYVANQSRSAALPGLLEGCMALAVDP